MRFFLLGIDGERMYRMGNGNHVLVEGAAREMNVQGMRIPGLVLIEPDVFDDERGCFLELYREERYREIVPARFVQDNHSFSRRGVLRGLHYQLGPSQGKLVTVLDGEIFDVVVDIRRGSPAFGRWESTVLSGANRRQLFVPDGFAHGFCVTGERALVVYKCTGYYNPASERGIRWDDPALAIPWPVDSPVLSPRDGGLPLLGEIPAGDLPEYGNPGV